MTARSALPFPYTVPASPPTIPGGEQRFMQAELVKIAASITSIARLTPQPATEAPKAPVDGMIRLSRSPWRPVGGTVDAWVFWDGPTSTWLLLHAH